MKEWIIVFIHLKIVKKSNLIIPIFKNSLTRSLKVEVVSILGMGLDISYMNMKWKKLDKEEVKK